MTYEEQFPCRAKIIRTKTDRDAAPLDQYHLPKSTGEFTGTLVFRCWHRNKPMLLCYFDTDEGRKVMLQAWYQSWGVNYSSKETLVNFADEVFDGSRWRCVYRKKENGYISWRRAEPVPRFIHPHPGMQNERPEQHLGARSCNHPVRGPTATPA